MRQGIVLLAVVMLASPAAAQKINLEQLRESTWMPRTFAICGIGFTSVQGCFLVADRTDLREQIAALRKQLRGTASDAELYFRLYNLWKRVGDNESGLLIVTDGGEWHRPPCSARGLVLPHSCVRIQCGGDREAVQGPARCADRLG